MSVEIGLRRGEVLLVEHSASWAQDFAREHRVLMEALDGFDVNIEHVGSTAVPGLPAKPIIDIAIAVASIQSLPRMIAPMEGLGYIDRGDSGADGGHLFVKEGSPDVRTHHVHVVEASDPQWQAWLRFRDLLRSDQGLRNEYARVKTQLSQQFPGDRRSYTAGKMPFIEQVLRSET